MPSTGSLNSARQRTTQHTSSWVPQRCAVPRCAAPRRRGGVCSTPAVSAASPGPSQPGFPAAYTATVQNATFERTPKHWLGAVGDRQGRVDAVKKLRLITALKTPYLPDGRVDLFAYDNLVEQQIAAGVEGLIVGGTTGEGHLMSWDEHIMLIAHTANRFGSRIAVIGNTGSNATREAVHATCQGFAVGMHAALHINPYYGKTSRDGLIYHFQAVLDYGPVIAYNVPGRTGQDIPPDVIVELAAHPNFAGVKECCGNDRIKGYTDQGITCWSGNDDEAHDARYSAGATGVISVTSNVVPGLMTRLMHGGADQALNAQLQPLMRWLFLQPNPIGVNTALAMLGAAPPVFRLPYAPYNPELRREGLAILETLGVQHCVRGPGESAARLRDVTDWTLLERY